MGAYLAALDLGTQSVKTAIMDAEGHLLSVSHEGYGLQTPRIGFVEQDPEEWWRAGAKTIREAVAKAGIAPDEIAGLGFSGQMHGVVALDAQNQLVGPAIIWMDQRSSLEAEEIRSAAGSLLEEQLLNRPVPGMMACSLLWMKKNQPDVYGRIHKVMLPKDYIRFRLTGEIGTDYADGSATGAFSVAQTRWCTELLEKIGLRTDIFPEAHECIEVAGTVSAEGAAQTGLKQGTKVVYGSGDAAAQLTGNAVVREGIIACNIGTASQISAAITTPHFDRLMRVQTFCHAVPGRWLFQGGTLNGGSTLSWLRNKMLQDKRPFSELDREAAETPAGSEGLIFVPYLAGERTPYMDPKAKGVYFGLSMKHEQGHLIRATMEGVLYNLRECLRIMDENGVPTQKVISSGGAAKGKTWKQIQADVLGMPVYTTATEEEACQGAAIQAAGRVGLYSSVDEACDAIVRLNPDPTEPIAANIPVYQEMQELFREIYANSTPIFQKLPG